MSVMWSMDNKFVLSGSNEMNVRVWKAKAAEKMGPVSSDRISFPIVFSSHHVRKQHSNTVRNCANSSRNIQRFEESPDTDKFQAAFSGSKV